VTSENTPWNNQMICPVVQIDLVRAYTKETSELIKIEIGDSCSAVLVDEEQMAMVMRYILPLNFLYFIGFVLLFSTNYIFPFSLVCLSMIKEM
jgi:hypothetical protein